MCRELIGHDFWVSVGVYGCDYVCLCGSVGVCWVCGCLFVSVGVVGVSATFWVGVRATLGACSRPFLCASFGKMKFNEQQRNNKKNIRLDAFCKKSGMCK